MELSNIKKMEWDALMLISIEKKISKRQTVISNKLSETEEGRDSADIERK